jgi:iron complex outermembrane receptor protein
MTFRLHASTAWFLRVGISTSALALAAAAAAQDGAQEPVVARAPLADTAAAVSVEGGADTEIVVTSRRRQERAQDVPIALTAVSGDTLERTGAINITQIAQLTPTLVIRNNNARNTFANIRGLGSNSDQNDGLEVGVGFYIDDVYYGRVGASQFDFVDLERVEVLRGPQGTLFGKNTTAGAINIVTRAPEFDYGFTGEASLGEDGYHQVRASLTGPIVEDQVAFRLMVSDTHRDGALVNLYNGRDINDYDNLSVRGQLLLRPAPNVDIRLIGDYSKQNAYSRVASVVGLFTQFANGAPLTNNWLDRARRGGYTPRFDISDPFAREVDVEGPVQADMEGYGVSGKVDWDLGSVVLTSITAWRGWDWLPDNDPDGTPLAVTLRSGTDNHQRQFSQELRLASAGDGRIDYVLGLYYFWQNVDALGHYQLGPNYAVWNNHNYANRPLADYAYTGFLSYSVIEPITRSYAAFGQATWQATHALSITAGLRFTYEDKTGLFHQYTAGGNDLALLSPADRAAAQALRDAIYPEIHYTTGVEDDALTGQVTIAYDVAPDVMTYATYSRGSKSGGLSLGDLPRGVSPVVEPETVDAWEVGLKSQLFDRAVTFNTALYWTEVQDYQAAITEQIGSTSSSIRYISNIPGVRSRGVEMDLAVAPTDWLRLTASAAYNDAVYKDYTNAQVAPENRNVTQVQDLSGVQLANAPKFVWYVSADLVQPVALISPMDELYARVDFNHRSPNDTSGSNSSYTRIPGYGVANARIGLRLDDERFDLAAWVTNLFDKQYFEALSASNQGLITGALGTPRTFGATLRTRF